MLTIRRTDPGELRRVLRLTLGAAGLTWAQLEKQVDAFQAYARQMNLDLSNNWVAHNGPEWLSVATFIESPGRTAMVFLSGGFDDPRRREATVQLLVEPRRFAEFRCVRFIQCLLDPSDRPPQALTRAGFTPLARLDYLDRATSAPVGHAARLPPGFEIRWTTYNPQTHSLFGEIILATYQESSDCRGLSGLRLVDEIMEGHKAATKFDPDWWLLLFDGLTPLGCLLLGEVPLRSAAEIVYMGLRPGARGRGLARILICKALELARGRRLRSIALAVDAANEPALRVYSHFGFRHTLSREAWICVLDPATKR